MRGAGFGVRGTGLGLLFQSSFQPKQDLCNSFTQCEQLGGIFCHSNSLGKDYRRFQLSQASASNTQELQVFASIASSVAFSDVAWDRDSGTSQLRCQFVSMVLGDLTRPLVSQSSKVHRKLPGIQFSVGLKAHRSNKFLAAPQKPSPGILAPRAPHPAPHFNG